MRSLPILVALSLTACAGPRDPWGGRYELHYRAATDTDLPYALDYNDRLFRGADGGYYCQREDASLGQATIDGATLPPELVPPRRSRKLGDLVTRPGGAAIRDAIERRALHCR